MAGVGGIMNYICSPLIIEKDETEPKPATQNIVFTSGIIIILIIKIKMKITCNAQLSVLWFHYRCI